MAHLDYVDANRVTEIRGTPRASFSNQVFSQIKRFAVLLYILAVIFSAMVVPFFRESILDTVKSWFQISG